MKIRIWLIQIIVDVIERFLFYPKLKKYYHLKFLKPDLEKDFTVFDVGSNRGQTIEFFSKINNTVKIYGFEPNPVLFDNLRNKYKNNNNISLLNIGISSKKGRLMFYENIMNETSTFEELNYDSEYLKKKARILGVSTKALTTKNYEVDVITLSSFLKEHNDIFVDIIKIDVEGHEYDCLVGLFNNSSLPIPVKFIQIEYHDNDMLLKNNAGKINSLLELNGFYEVKRIKHSFGSFFEVVYENKKNR